MRMNYLPLKVTDENEAEGSFLSVVEIGSLTTAVTQNEARVSQMHGLVTHVSWGLNEGVDPYPSRPALRDQILAVTASCSALV